MPVKLVRPKLLARAARIGATAYQRNRDLRRFLPKLPAGGGRAALLTSIAAAEASCEEERKTGAASYSIERHIGLLAAFLAETRAKASAV